VTVGEYMAGLKLFGLIDTGKETTALEADLERGMYPIFRANATTFSLKVAESRKDSLTTMFELNAVI
jgi:hypothetical protein